MGKLSPIPRAAQVVDSADWGPPPAFPLPCVWLRRTAQVRQKLRRVALSRKCPQSPYGWYCSASRWIGDTKGTLHPTMEGDSTKPFPHGDARWPKQCPDCGYRFTPKDSWIFDQTRLYHYNGSYGDHMVTIRGAPPGSVYSAKWLEGTKKNPYTWAIGPDGLALHAVCPDGRHWHIDGQASNCTMPQDKGKVFVRTHYCWVRHGNPRNPSTLHVDKNGVTCQAGAGSIDTGKYHGFLHHGGFTPG